VTSTGRKPLYTHLYFQVVCAILIGILLGHFHPALAVKMQPLGEAFIKTIKMLIAPIIFCTVVHGIASMNDMKKVGRVGLKAIIYFEVVTTLALFVGLVIVNLWQPGAGMNVDPSAIDTKSIQGYATQAKSQNTVDYLLHIIPATVVGAFSEGEILQVLFISILFAFALHMAGERGKPVLSVIESAAQVFFGIVAIVMRAAPLGAFGAMAFTIGKYGIGSLASLAELMAAFYTTCLIFILGVLGIIARLTGFSILRFIRYIKEELLIVLGTSSSEAVLPRMIAKMEILGCDESVVGLVIPAGYSFNLDGTAIYLTLATVFITQAMNIDLSWGQVLGMLFVMLLTSKGAAGVTGSGFVALVATLTIFPEVPVAGVAIIVGIDRFMSEARALTSMVSNTVAVVVVSMWERACNREVLQRELDNNYAQTEETLEEAGASDAQLTGRVAAG
jgi:aerobic C4-dicarboxylate transport protein